MAIEPTIMKFGGTSVEDARAFERVAQIVRERVGSHPVVIVSAMSRFTDALLESVRTAAEEGDPQRAALLLESHLARHADVARSLLAPEQAEAFRTEIESARHEITELLRIVASPPVTRPPLQDEIVAYGERLSSFLLAAVLRQSG